MKTSLRAHRRKKMISNNVNCSRSLLEKTEGNLSSTTEALNKRSSESNSYQEKCAEQDRQIQGLIVDLHKEKDYSDKMRAQCDHLSAEKEQLKDEIEVRLNKIRSLTDELESKVIE